MKRTRRFIKPTLRLEVDAYKLVCRAVEDGITAGWYRAHKHTETPGSEEVKWQIESEIMNQLSEIFIWPSAYDE